MVRIGFGAKYILKSEYITLMKKDFSKNGLRVITKLR